MRPMLVLRCADFGMLHVWDFYYFLSTLLSLSNRHHSRWRCVSGTFTYWKERRFCLPWPTQLLESTKVSITLFSHTQWCKCDCFEGFEEFNPFGKMSHWTRSCVSWISREMFLHLLRASVEDAFGGSARVSAGEHLLLIPAERWCCYRAAAGCHVWATKNEAGSSSCMYATLCLCFFFLPFLLRMKCWVSVYLVVAEFSKGY